MRWHLAPLALLAAAAGAAAADRPKPDPAAVAATIDRLVTAKLAERGVKPAPPADDATFFRRVNLALAGRIPLPADVRAFVADRDPDKRRKAIDRLLASNGHVNHFTTLWRSWMLPEAVTNFELAYQVAPFEDWLRSRLKANTPYDKLVTELVTAPMNGQQNQVAPTTDELQASRQALTPIAF